MRTRFGYTIFLYLLLPYVGLRLLWRGRKQPGYWRHIAERFGFFHSHPSKPVIWLHAVSVGETRAALPLIQQLQTRYPQYQILLTHMTPTGRDTGEELFGDSVLRSYLPYDFPFAVRRFLKHFKPAIGVLMETEIWFNLIHACNTSRIPVLLINARLSEKSAHQYAKFAQLTQESLRGLSGIAAQTEVDAARLTALGARHIQITGNLKFDISPPQSAIELGQVLRQQFGEGRPIFLAASTREGEEALLLNALQHANMPDLLTVIVPRHPQRFDAVAALLDKRGIRYQRRSANLAIRSQTQVVLGDSMGEMFAYYSACDIAFIGGSLLPLGGQNLIEACTLGKPVLLGPHTYNFAEVSELAVTVGAAIRVQDAGELLTQVAALIQDKQKQREMRQAGLDFSRQHQGATDRVMRLMDGYLLVSH